MDSCVGYGLACSDAILQEEADSLCFETFCYRKGNSFGVLSHVLDDGVGNLLNNRKMLFGNNNYMAFCCRLVEEQRVRCCLFINQEVSFFHCLTKFARRHHPPLSSSATRSS